MEKLKLGELAEIRLGYSFRSSILSEGNASLSVIQPRDIFNNNFENLAKIKSGNIKDKHFLNNGDILLTNRGKFTAYLFDGTLFAIASGGIFILTVKDRKKIMPAYLTLFLNSVLGQQSLTAKQEITTIRAVTADKLKEISVMLPSFAKQKMLADFARTRQREEDILKQLQTLKQKRYDQIVKGVINA
jgi:restriction endonuclease S subunit